MPSYSESSSTVVCAALDSVRLARSQAVRRRRRERGLSLMSFLFLRLNSCRGNGQGEGVSSSRGSFNRERGHLIAGV
jgi:hypothetical protein